MEPVRLQAATTSELESNTDTQTERLSELHTLPQVVRLCRRCPRLTERSNWCQAVPRCRDSTVAVAQVTGKACAFTVLNEVVPLVEDRGRLPIEQVEDVGLEHQPARARQPDWIPCLQIGFPVLGAAASRSPRYEVVLPVVIRQ